MLPKVGGSVLSSVGGSVLSVVGICVPIIGESVGLSVITVGISLPIIGGVLGDMVGSNEGISVGSNVSSSSKRYNSVVHVKSSNLRNFTPSSLCIR